MEQQSIPEVSFRQTTKNRTGFEIFRLRHLLSQTKRLRVPLDTPHRVTFFHVMFVTQGAGTHYIDFQPYSYRENSLLFVSKGQLHAFDVNPEIDGYVIVFTEEFLLRNLGQFDQPYFYKLYAYHLHEPLLQVEQHMKFAELFDEIFEEFNSTEAFAREEVLQLLLKLLLLKIERVQHSLMPPAQNTEWAKLFVDFHNLLHQSYHRSRNATDYAAQLGVSYKHLNEVCKAISGRTAKVLIDEFVVLEIKRLLAISDDSIQQLAYQTGFDEPTNFVKYFKKHTDQSPAQFRRHLADKHHSN